MDVFAAIADPVRRDILSLLATRPAAAGVVAASFDISRPAVSRHLRVLRDAGLVSCEATGRRLIYAATTAPLGDVTTWISSLAPGFSVHLDALETEVYRTRRERARQESHASPADTNKEHTA